MSFRSTLLVPASLLVFLATLPGQSTSPQDLPSAPSAAKEGGRPQKAPPATPHPAPETPGSDATPAAPGSPDAAKTAASTPSQQTATAAESAKPSAAEPGTASQDDESVSTIRRTVN